MEIFNIGNIVLNNYILRIPDGYLVIDTGYSGSFDRFRKSMETQQIHTNEISYIFLTHAHDDHAGFLGELLSVTNAKVIVHQKSPQRLLAGHNQWIGGCSSALAKAFVGCMNIAGKGKHEFPAVNISDRAIVWDGKTQILQENGIPLQIIALPGHTADSIGLLSESGELFCGDAAMNGFPSYKRNIIWIENLQDYTCSWGIMINSNAKIIYPAHGAPFPASDLKRFRKYLGRIKLR